MTNSYISSQIHTQVPDFVKENYQTFITFLEKYYEWLESSGNPGNAIQNLTEYQDIDTTLSSLLVFFEREYTPLIPSNTNVDKALLIKNIKEFYRARGTEKSFEFFFRVVFGQDVDFLYPREYVLKFSDGVWTRNVSLRVNQVCGDPFDFYKQKIVGSISGASARVQDVRKVQYGNSTIYTLSIGDGNVQGDFLADETVTFGDVCAKIVPVVTGITITNAGKGYEVGESITLDHPTGIGAKAQIQTVHTDDSIIVKCSILDQGAFYYSEPTVTIPSPTILTDPEQATATATVGALFESEGYYIGNKGQLSSNIRIQDSYYWQQFSYVLRVAESFEQYQELIKRNLHPSGFKIFGEFAPKYVKKTGKTLNGSGFDQDNSLNIFIPVPSKIVSYQLNTEISLQVPESETAYKLGPSLKSLERDKFTFTPTENNYENEQMYGPNRDYYRYYTNSPAEHFPYTEKDVTNTPHTKIPFVPEVYLINTLNDGNTMAVPKELSLTFSVLRPEVQAIKRFPVERMRLDVSIPHFNIVTRNNLFSADFDASDSDQVTTNASDDSRVSAFSDKTGNVSDLTQSTDAYKPFLTQSANVENIHPIESYSGSWTGTTNVSITGDTLTKTFNKETTRYATITETATTGLHEAYVLSNVLYSYPGMTIRWIFSVKRLSGDGHIKLRGTVGIGTNGTVTVDLDTGSITSTSGSITESGSIDQGDGFYKVWFDIPFPDDQSKWVSATYVNLLNSSSETSYAGDVGNSVYISVSVQQRPHTASLNSVNVDLADMAPVIQGANGQRMLAIQSTYNNNHNHLVSTTTLSDLFSTDRAHLDFVLKNTYPQNSGVLLADSNKNFLIKNTPGQSAHFDSEDSQYLYLANANIDDLAPGDNDFSWSFWIKCDETPGIGTKDSIISLYSTSGSNRSYDISINSDMEIVTTVSSDGSTETVISSTDVITLNEWAHVVVTHNATDDEIGIYIDGNAPTIDSHSGGAYGSTNANFAIGCSFPSGSAGQFFNGDLTYVGYWYGKTLDQDEVTWLYNLGKGQQAEMLTGRMDTGYAWNLNEHCPGGNFNIVRSCVASDYDLSSSGNVSSVESVPNTSRSGKTYYQIIKKTKAHSAQFTAANTETLSLDSAKLDQLAPGDNSFSVCFWIKPTTALSAFVVLAGIYGGDGDQSWAVYTSSSGNIRFVVTSTGNTAEQLYTGSNIGNIFTEPKWYFVHASYDAVRDIMYVGYNNQAFDSTENVAGGAYDSPSGDLMFGGYSGSVNNFDGQMCRVAYWYNKVLTPNELSWLYNNGEGRSRKVLDQYNLYTKYAWDLDEYSDGSGAIPRKANESRYVLDDNNTVTSLESRPKFSQTEIIEVETETTIEPQPLDYISLDQQQGRSEITLNDGTVVLDQSDDFDDLTGTLTIAAANSQNHMHHPYMFGQLMTSGEDLIKIGQNVAVLNSSSSEYLYRVNASIDDLAPGDNDFSIAFWIKPFDITTNNYVISVYNSTGNNRCWTARITSSGYAQFIVSANGEFATTSVLTDTTTQLIEDEWNFVVCVHDSVNDLIKVSVNNSPFTTIAHSGGAYGSTTADFLIGSENAGTLFCDAEISNVSYWYDKAIDSSDVEWLYNNSQPRSVKENGKNNIHTPYAWDLDEYSDGSSAVVRHSIDSSYNLTDSNPVTSKFDFRKKKYTSETKNMLSEKWRIGRHVAKFDASITNQLYLPKAKMGNLTPGDNNFSGCAWIKPYQKNATGAVFGHYSSAGNFSYLFYLASGEIRLLASSDGTATTYDGVGSIDQGVWTFVYFTYDASTDQITVGYNDESPHTFSHSGGFYNSSADFTVGRANGNDFNGEISRISLWYDKVLSSDEISWMYNNGNGRNHEEFGVVGTDGSDLLTDFQWDLDQPSDGTFSVSRPSVNNNYNLLDQGNVQSTFYPSKKNFNQKNLIDQAVSDFNADLFTKNESTISVWKDSKQNVPDWRQDDTSKMPILSRNDGFENLVLDSGDFTTSNWTRTNASVTGNTMQASAVTSSSGVYEHSSNGFVQGGVDQTMRIIVEIQAGTHDYVWIGNVQTSFIGCNVDLNSGTILSNYGVTSSITGPDGSGYYRIIVEGSWSSASKWRPGIYFSQPGTQNTPPSFTLAGTETVLIKNICCQRSHAIPEYIKTEQEPQISGVGFDMRENLYENPTNLSGILTPIRTTIVENSIKNPVDQKCNGSLVYEDSDVSQKHTAYPNYYDMYEGRDYVFSVFAKSAGRHIALRSNYAGGGFDYAYVDFDLDSGTVHSTDGAVVDSNIEDYGDGWYRCSITATATSGGNLRNWAIYLTSTPGTNDYDGDGSSGVYIYGPQVRDSESDDVFIGRKVTRGSSAKRSLVFDGSRSMISNGTLDTLLNEQFKIMYIVFRANGLSIGSDQFLLGCDNFSISQTSGTNTLKILNKDSGGDDVDYSETIGNETTILKLIHDGFKITHSIATESSGSFGTEQELTTRKTNSMSDFVGLGSNEDGDANFFHGDISRIITFDKVASEEEMNVLDQFLINEYL
jgi:hypothetical protein